LREAPAKAALGFHRYEEAWKSAVEIFGPNQVSSFLIVGLGENPSSVLEGSEFLADLGVYPFVVPLRPIPGSRLSMTMPPPPDLMKGLYEKTAHILSKKGLSAARSRAGCVRCGACSALVAFEKEASKKLVCHLVRTKKELEQALETRREVFVREQGIFEGSDQDEDDWKSVHLVAEGTEGIVGTVRVFPSEEGRGHWVGGRLAVKKAYRASGAGELLVREAVRYVRRQGCRHFTAHIQVKNVHFFERLGWKKLGPMETYCGQLHQLMEADLGQAAKRESDEYPELQPAVTASPGKVGSHLYKKALGDGSTQDLRAWAKEIAEI
jgi:putative N-acetyltransferase (TIGR04045 family)